MSDAPVSTPAAAVSQGYALPEFVRPVSAAAPLVRAAAAVANISSYELPVRSRSIVDQNDLPCCVSCALAAAMEVIDPRGPALAAAFHYYVARYGQGGADIDGFLYLDNALATLGISGICRKNIHQAPFTQQGLRTKPSAAAYADASARALGSSDTQSGSEISPGISNATWIREQLRRNRPVVIGLQLPVGYPKTFLNRKYEWLQPEDHPMTLSGHCVLVTGYNDLRQAIHIQDSQGTGCFDGGRWWLGYRVVDSSVVQQVYSLFP